MIKRSSNTCPATRGASPNELANCTLARARDPRQIIEGGQRVSARDAGRPGQHPARLDLWENVAAEGQGGRGVRLRTRAMQASDCFCSRITQDLSDVRQKVFNRDLFGNDGKEHPMMRSEFSLLLVPDQSAVPFDSETPIRCNRAGAQTALTAAQS